MSFRSGPSVLHRTCGEDKVVKPLPLASRQVPAIETRLLPVGLGGSPVLYASAAFRNPSVPIGFRDKIGYGGAW